jgi:hypothetical protein
MLTEQDEYTPTVRSVGRPPIPVEKVQSILALRLVEELSYREISKRLNISHETCRRYCRDKFWLARYTAQQDPVA